MDAQRALLDALMGWSREKKDHWEVFWDNPNVCTAYMSRFCPHDLLINTKSDLGVCPKIHDPALKQNFEKSLHYKDFHPKFEADLFHSCERLVQDLDKKVRHDLDRLTQEVVERPPPAAHGSRLEQLAMLKERIKKLLEQIEELGNTGKIDEAIALMRKVSVLEIGQAGLTHQIESKVPMIPNEKKMELCKQCGSFLVTNDVLERTQSHVTGKQHIGYGLVRAFLAEYKAARKAKRLAKEKKEDECQNLRDRGYNNRGHRDYHRERSRERLAKEKKEDEHRNRRGRGYHDRGHHDDHRERSRERLAKKKKEDECQNRRDRGYNDRGHHDYHRERSMERLAKEKKDNEHQKRRDRGYRDRDHRDDHRERSREYDRDRYYERSRDRERPYEQGGRGSDYRGGSYNRRRDSERARHRERSRERLAKEKKDDKHQNRRDRGYRDRDQHDDHRERSREYDRERYYERSRDRERPYEQGGRGSDYRGGSYNRRRDSERARHMDRNGVYSRRDPGRMRSRSRSPGRHGY